jgi:RHS repeat-associated protein
VGNKTREIDAEERESVYTYDNRNRIISGTDTAGNTTTYEYNGDGRLTRQIDPDGKTITYRYDNDGRLAKTIDGVGNEITMEYGTAQSGCATCSGTTEQPSTIIYPTFTREYTYDVRGRKTKELDNLDTETVETNYTYDGTGNLIEKTDGEGNITLYQYDGRNRLTTVTDPDRKTTIYTYDDRDNLITLTDGENHTTAFEYDRNNRLTKETRPMGEETTYQYDENGNLIEKTDAKNQKIVYTYDDAGRLETIEYYSSTDHTTPTKTVTFTYDKLGNILTYSDGTTNAAYTYDDAYRKTTETTDYGAFIKTNTYTYNDNGTKKTFTGPDGITYTYTYDDNNKISSVTIPDQGSITWPNYTWIRPQSITLPGGSQKAYAYDSLMRVKDITTKDPGQNNILHYQYDYDRMDNITDKETEHGTYTYQYDNLYRLTNTDSPTIQNEAYTYDAVGNRITSAQTQNDWTYNQNNELETNDDTTYEYDANGNMIRKTVNTVVTNYIYSEEDRLTEVRDGSDTLIASYYYDPFGRRLWKEVAGLKTYFHYTDEGLIGEYDSTGTELKTYGYTPNSTWTTDPLFMKENGTYYFYQNDHLGTPQKLTAINGAVAWSATYESFGKAQIDGTSTITNNLRFPGQYYDAETGLQYNFHRYYDSGVGRYVRVDPINIASTQLPVSIVNRNVNFSIYGLPIRKPYQLFTYVPSYKNYYNYVLGNPVNSMDPFGEFEMCKWVGEGPKHVRYGSWDFLRTIPPEQYISAGIVLTMRVTCVYEKRIKCEQKGHWECCGLQVPSYNRTWSDREIKETSGKIYPVGSYHTWVIICDLP